MLNFNYYLNIFNSIVEKYYSIANSEVEEKNIKHKIIHSNNVKNYAEKIACAENFTEEDIFLAKICGQFHDIGRFEQYTKYHVFKDDEKQNHSDLAIEVIEKNNIFSKLNKENKEIIYNAILNHSKYKIEKYQNKKELLYSKLLRDADKLDIFNILSQYYNAKLQSNRNIAKEYLLSNEDKISNNIVEKIKTKTLINKNEVKTINDMKIMQISWIFDINFEITKKIIKENNFINIILNSINNSEEKNIISNNIKNYL